MKNEIVNLKDVLNEFKESEFKWGSGVNDDGSLRDGWSDFVINWWNSELEFCEDRNIVLEGQICVSIFNKIVEELSIIDIYKDEPKVDVTKKVMNKILGVILKSPRVRYYYTNLYKPRFAGPLIIDYMQTNFGL